MDLKIKFKTWKYLKIKFKHSYLFKTMELKRYVKGRFSSKLFCV